MPLPIKAPPSWASREMEPLLHPHMAMSTPALWVHTSCWPAGLAMGIPSMAKSRGTFAFLLKRCCRAENDSPPKHCEPPGCHSAGRIPSMAECPTAGQYGKTIGGLVSKTQGVFVSLWFWVCGAGRVSPSIALVLVWSAAVLWNGVMPYEVCPAGKETVWEGSWQESAEPSAPIPAVLDSPYGARQRASRAVSHAQCGVHQWHLS